MKRAESLHGPLHSLECKLSSFVSIFSLALTRVRRIVTVLAAITVLGTLWSAPACAIEYIYDELGRVVGVVDSTGASVRYNYDGLGNIVSIDRFGVAAISILEFTPNRGPIGTSVTINGTGFSATAAQNTVKFNGVTAPIIGASTTKLIVAVPATATTGKVTVTAPAGTATSTTDFVIATATAGAPTVTSFTPTSGVAGTVVAVTGTNFDPASGATSVRFNESRAASVTAVTATTLNATVPTNTGSGRIRVVTANGSGSSATDFIIPPSGILAADMVANRRIVVGGAGQALTIATANKVGALLFDAAAGAYLTLNVTAIATTPAASAVTYQIYDPRNVLVVSGSVSAPRSIHIPQITTTGTHTIYFRPTTSTATLTAAVVANKAIVLNGASLTETITFTGQTARLSFPGTAGQNLGIGITGLTLTPTTATYATVTAYSPTNVQIASTNCYTNGSGGSGCDINLPNLATTGTYSIVVTPAGGATGSFTATLSSDVAGTLTAGTPFALVIGRAGQNGRLSFSGTAGQNLGLTLSAVTFTGTGATGVGSITVYKPDGTTLVGTTSFAAGATTIRDLPTLPTTGTYTVFIDPPSAATASMNVLVSADVLATLTLNGTPTNVSITQTGQTARLSFAGTAGQNLGIGITGLTLAPTTATYATVIAYSPTNVQIASTNCSTNGNGCDINLPNLAATGTYSVVVTPINGATGSFTATLSSDVASTLTAGTPFALTIGRAGQNGRLGFSGTAGQNVGLTLSAVTFAGTGATGSGVVTIYKPDGTYLDSIGFTAGRTTVLDLPTLPTTGTYSFFIDPPSAATASMNVLVSADVLATLTLNGTPTNVSITQTGQTARLSFAGTAGQNLGIGITGLILTPTTATYATVYVYTPTGAYLNSTICYTAGNGCGINLPNLVVTGTYSVVVTPASGATGSFTATLSSDLTGTLTASTPFAFTTGRAGQNGRLSFSGTAGQNLGLTLSAVTFTGTGATGSGAVTVYKPDGTTLSSIGYAAGTTTVLDLPTLPTTGTYTFFIDPPSAATASMNVLVSADVLATLTLNGTPTNVSIAQTGQTARLSFAGTAGQNLGIGITGLTLTPTTATYATVIAYSPTNVQIASANCYTTGSGGSGCGINFVNLATTGTYSVVVTPGSDATGSFTATLSSDLTGTLTAGTAFNLNLARAGQNGRLSFSGTAGQNRTLSFASIVKNPTTAVVSFTVYQPNGTAFTSTSTSAASTTLNLNALPVTGTYTLFVDPVSNATASMAITLSP